MPDENLTEPAQPEPTAVVKTSPFGNLAITEPKSGTRAKGWLTVRGTVSEGMPVPQLFVYAGDGLWYRQSSPVDVDGGQWQTRAYIGPGSGKAITDHYTLVAVLDSTPSTVPYLKTEQLFPGRLLSETVTLVYGEP